jgi:hypothetical protein
MIKVEDVINNLMFVQRVKGNGNVWHIHKEFWNEEPITYCDLVLSFNNYRTGQTNNLDYEWQTGKKWMPEKICQKCIKNLQVEKAN